MPTLSIRAKSRGLAASLEASRLRREDTLRRVSLDVRNAFRNLETARAQLEAVNVELNALRLVAEGINNEFQFGQKTTLDLLDAEQDVNDAEMRQVDADHAVLMASFRLRAASGTLTATSFGLDDVYGPLDQMEPIEPRFKRWIPLEVEWPEGGFDDSSSGQPIPVAELPAAPETLPVVQVMQAAPAGETVVATAPEPSHTVVVEGIVWDIKTEGP
jgi:hypothetical protein